MSRALLAGLSVVLGEAATHYGTPGSCLSDEITYDSYKSGVFGACVSDCESTKDASSCPKDKPAEATGEPTCKEITGARRRSTRYYCTLSCEASSDCQEGHVCISGHCFHPKTELCGWCAGGECDSECDASKRKLFTSISHVEGKLAPYYVPSSAAVQDLQAPEVYPDVELAALSHHGMSRNGGTYLCSMHNSVRRYFGEAFAREKVLVFAPQFSFLEDAPDEDELYWDDTGSSSWAWGGNSTKDLGASISSYRVLDELLLELANATRFPNLRRLVVAGHSAGGQILQRYAMSNMVHEVLLARGVAVEYFPANPSDMTYLSAERPILRSEADTTCDNRCDNETILTTKYDFAERPSGRFNDDPDACPHYNNWGYGLNGTKVEYVENVGNAAMLRNFAQRDVTYLVGLSDVCDTPWESAHSCHACSIYDHGLATSCAAYAQGWCRTERMVAFFQHVRRFYQNESMHSLVPVPGVGHSGCGMMQSPEAQKAMWGDFAKTLLQV